MSNRPKHLKYIHIEYDLLTHPDLNDKEKLVLANIVSVIGGGGTYKFDNKFIADYLDCHPNHASRVVSGLKKKGWIDVELVKNKGNNSIAYRVLTLTQICINNFVDTGINKSVKHNNKVINTDITANNNKNNTDNKVLSNSSNLKNYAKVGTPEHTEQINNFTKFWELYDYKVGFNKSWKAWKKIDPKLYVEIFEAVKVYVKNTFKEPDKYPSRKHPLTWINNESWNDEVQIVDDNSDLEDQWRRTLDGSR